MTAYNIPILENTGSISILNYLLENDGSDKSEIHKTLGRSSSKYLEDLVSAGLVRVEKGKGLGFKPAKYHLTDKGNEIAQHLDAIRKLMVGIDQTPAESSDDEDDSEEGETEEVSEEVSGESEQRSLAPDDHSDGVAAAQAERRETDVLVPVVQSIDERGEHAGSGASDGMSEGDGSAVDVELLVGDMELLLDRAGCRGEGLVVLEEVDIVDGHARLLHDMPGCGYRRLHDELGLDTLLAVGDDGCEGLAAVLLGPPPRGDDQRRRAVAELRGVGRGDYAVLLEHGL